MCKSASFKVRKNQVFFSKYSDSHSVIAKENKIPDDESSVSVEITPPNNDYSLPFEQWQFIIDSNYPLPDWWSNKWAEEQCREMLPEWSKTHIYRNVDIEIDLSGIEQPSLYFFNCKVKLTGQTGGNCCFYDSSTGTVTGQTGGNCWFYDSSTGTVTGQTGGNCCFYDSSTGTVTGQTGGDCWFFGSSTKL